jgi:hypothetical protein
MKNTVYLLDDGRIEVRFGRSIPEKKGLWLILAVGWAKDSEVLVKRGRVVGVRCHPDVWETLLRRWAPEKVSEFRKVLEELRSKTG